MKKIHILTLFLLVPLTSWSRVPDAPDYTDENGYQYKHFRNEVSGRMIKGREKEVQFWGVDTRYSKQREKWAAVKKFTVPTKMVVKRADGKVITMPVTAVDGNAFCAMPNLEEIIVPEGITYVNPFALSGTKAKRISIPSSWIDHIYDFHGYKCQWERITVSNAHPTRCSINGLMYSKDKSILYVYPRMRQGAVTLPTTLKQIAEDAFREAEHVSTITVPEGVVEIGKSAFYESSASTITLPSTLTKLGINALNCCRQLTTLRCKAATPPAIAVREDDPEWMELWGMNVESLQVYIPKGSRAAYEKAIWWRKIKNYVEDAQR